MYPIIGEEIVNANGAVPMMIPDTLAEVSLSGASLCVNVYRLHSHIVLARG